MIRFLRTIRRNLLSENKFTKYLVYAFGEIVLVIIGILIALQINNSSERFKAQEETNTFLIRLQSEIKRNIELTEAEIKTEENQYLSAKELLDLFHAETTELNQLRLDTLVNKVLISNEVIVMRGTLNEGLNSGLVGRIQNDSLKLELYNFPDEIESIRQYETIQSNDIENNLMPYLYRNFNFRRMDNTVLGNGIIGESKFQTEDYKQLLNDKEFENMMDNRIMNTLIGYKKYGELLQKLKRLDRLTATYLDQK